MSKFWLPNQKGLELYPAPTKIPTSVRVILDGKEVNPVMADSMISQYAGALSQFHYAQAQNYALSDVALYRASAELAPGVIANYSNQQGADYITLNISQPKKPLEKEKEKEQGFLEIELKEYVPYIVICNVNSATDDIFAAYLDSTFLGILDFTPNSERTAFAFIWSNDELTITNLTNYFSWYFNPVLYTTTITSSYPTPKTNGTIFMNNLSTNENGNYGELFVGYLPKKEMTVEDFQKQSISNNTFLAVIDYYDGGDGESFAIPVYWPDPKEILDKDGSVTIKVPI